MDQYEREEEAILNDEAEGRISHAEAMRQLRDLQADYRAAAENAALDAYERELDNW